MRSPVGLCKSPITKLVMRRRTLAALRAIIQMGAMCAHVVEKALLLSQSLASRLNRLGCGIQAPDQSGNSCLRRLALRLLRVGVCQVAWDEYERNTRDIPAS